MMAGRVDAEDMNVLTRHVSPGHQTPPRKVDWTNNSSVLTIKAVCHASSSILVLYLSVGLIDQHPFA